MPERLPINLDILTTVEFSNSLYEELLANDCIKIGTLSIGGTSWKTPKGEILDVLVLNQIWVEDAIKYPTYFEDKLPIIPLPYLILMKLEASRLQDIADISRMLGRATDKQLNQVRKVIQEYQPDAVEDVESLIALGKLEY